jgi:hypothetical protein
MKGNQDHQNSNNEVEDVMFKGHPHHKSTSDEGALTDMCGRDEEL